MGLGAIGLPNARHLRRWQIAFDNEGRPSFPVLCDRVLHRRSTAPLMYAIFEVLELEGRPTAPLPYGERRSILEALDLGGGGWFTPDVYDDGLALFAAVVEAGLEGIVAKRLADSYRPGERAGSRSRTGRTGASSRSGSLPALDRARG